MFVSKKTHAKLQEWADYNQQAYLRSTQKLIKVAYRNAALITALQEIVNQETEHANATVARMAKIAREALQETDED